MKKITTFMLLAAALLVSVPSSAYEPGELTTLNQYTPYFIGNYGNTNSFGTICVPERIVAIQGITIYDVLCVDMFYNGDGKDSTKVARLVVDVHTNCNKEENQMIDEFWSEKYADNEAEPFCPKETDGSEGPCGEDNTKTYIDWSYDYNPDNKIETWEHHDFRMKAGAAYFYTICAGITKTENCSIWVDKGDKASEPVCVNGFYGTFEDTKVNEPVMVLAQDVNTKEQYLDHVKSATIPAHRGYFKGYFECVPWRWNTDNKPTGPEPGKAYPDGNNNPIHYRCSDAPKVPRRVSSNAIAFNVGPRDMTTGLYPIDLEHPIYLGKETNKRIENGQLIIEAADGTKYNAFGQRVK